jgi:hypothetical protein
VASLSSGIGNRPAACRNRIRTGGGNGLGAERIPGVEQNQRRILDVKFFQTLGLVVVIHDSTVWNLAQKRCQILQRLPAAWPNQRLM